MGETIGRSEAWPSLVVAGEKVLPSDVVKVIVYLPSERPIPNCNNCPWQVVWAPETSDPKIICYGRAPCNGHAVVDFDEHRLTGLEILGLLDSSEKPNCTADDVLRNVGTQYQKI
ncbi:MAG: hypothetical protein WC686_01920 [Candidatus Shapirobacteria bacterium]|jgi:hypothetical protein